MSGGIEASSLVVHKLFDPLIEAASALGAGLDWKTSLQELAADQSLGVPEYVIEDDGPDHMKTFTAQVRVADRMHGNGVGRSKKEAEQAAAETAYRAIAGELGITDVGAAEPQSARRRRALRHRRIARCLSSPRSRSSGPASRATCSAAPSSGSRCSTLAPYAATRAVPRASPRPWSGGGSPTPGRRGKYFWLPLDNGDALLGHLGMSGQMLVQPTEAPPERHLRVRIVLDGGRDIRFADQRMFGGLLVSRRRRRPPARDRPHRPRPARPRVRRRRVRTPGAQALCRGEAAAARPGPDLRRRQHLRRRGAVAGPDPRRPARPTGSPPPRSATCSATPAP